MPSRLLSEPMTKRSYSFPSASNGAFIIVCDNAKTHYLHYAEGTPESDEEDWINSCSPCRSPGLSRGRSLSTSPSPRNKVGCPHPSCIATSRWNSDPSVPSCLAVNVGNWKSMRWESMSPSPTSKGQPNRDQAPTLKQRCPEPPIPIDIGLQRQRPKDITNVRTFSDSDSHPRQRRRRKRQIMGVAA